MHVTTSILDLASLVERVRLSIFATLFPMNHVSCQTRSIFFLLSLPSSLHPDGRPKGHLSSFSACLLAPRCVSRGKGQPKKLGPSLPLTKEGRVGVIESLSRKGTRDARGQGYLRAHSCARPKRTTAG